MKNGGAEVSILRTLPVHGELNKSLADTLQWALDLVRRNQVLGYAVVVRHLDADGDPETTSASGVGDKGAIVPMLGQIRIMEHTFIQRVALPEMVDPRDAG